MIQILILVNFSLQIKAKTSDLRSNWNILVILMCITFHTFRKMIRSKVISWFIKCTLLYLGFWSKFSTSLHTFLDAIRREKQGRHDKRKPIKENFFHLDHFFQSWQKRSKRKKNTLGAQKKILEKNSPKQYTFSSGIMESIKKLSVAGEEMRIRDLASCSTI